MIIFLLTMAMLHSHCGYLQDQINMLIDNASVYGVTNKTLDKLTREYISQGCSIYNSTFSGFIDGWHNGVNDFNISRSACIAPYDPDYCKGYNQGYKDSLTLSESGLSDHFYREWKEKNNITVSLSSGQ